MMRPVSFLKMHGLGNDFVVIDPRDAFPLTPTGRAPSPTGGAASAATS